MGGDSNPRYLAVNTLSRRAQSTTLPPILVRLFFSAGGNTAAIMPFCKREEEVKKEVLSGQFSVLCGDGSGGVTVVSGTTASGVGSSGAAALSL